MNSMSGNEGNFQRPHDMGEEGRGFKVIKVRLDMASTLLLLKGLWAPLTLIRPVFSGCGVPDVLVQGLN